MSLSIIAAMDSNGVIGRQGGLPWRLSSDLRRFRQLTTGHAIIMGRKTWDSIARPLPDRTSIVISRQTDLPLPQGVLRASSLAQALELAGGDNEPFVIGGAEAYRLALPLAGRLYLTQVDAEVEGDTHFPAWQPQQWRELSSQAQPASQRDEYAHVFRILERRPADAARQS